MALVNIFCERCPTCGSGQMTPPFARGGEAWQACFVCGQPVVLKIDGGVSDDAPAGEPLDDASASQAGEDREAKLRRRYEVLLKALEGMLVSEAEHRKKYGLARPEPEVLLAARQDLKQAAERMDSARAQGRTTQRRNAA